jgi:hypothetical protein
MYGGTYALTDTLMYVSYAVYPPNSQPSPLIEYVVNGNTMTITVPGASPTSFTVTRVAEVTRDGVYDGSSRTHGPGVPVAIRTQVLSNTYLSYNLQSGATGGFFGVIAFPTPTTASITYAYAAPFSHIAPGTVISSGFTDIGGVLEINATNFISTLQTKRAASAIDGTWVGTNHDASAYQTVELTRGLYRSYAMGFGRSYGSNSAFLGSVDTNATHLVVKYGYTQPTFSDLEGKEYTFDYTLSTDGNVLTISGSIIPTALVLRKATVPPAANEVNVTLATTFSVWAGNATLQQLFIEALAARLGVNPSVIIVLAAWPGSVNLKFLILDDQSAQVSHTTSVNTLEGLGSVGGYTVTEVVVGPGVATTGSSSTGLQGNMAPTVAISSLQLLLIIALGIVAAML